MAEAEQQYSFPPFDDLPKVEGMPQGNIWGYFDKNGKKDEVGSQFGHQKNLSMSLT
jgi:hypothetical protein